MRCAEDEEAVALCGVFYKINKAVALCRVFKATALNLFMHRV
jgi:hypothetical protein